MALPLQHIIAEPVIEGLCRGTNPPDWFPIPEGPAFDREGKLWFLNAYGDDEGTLIFRLDIDTGELEKIYRGSHAFASLVPHQNGRIFLAEFGNGELGGGRVASMAPDGTDMRTEVGSFEGTPIVADDLVFDRHGNYFYNDYQGTVENPIGRTIRVTPDGTQTLVVDGLAHPNGIALNTAQNRLWVSDHYTNRLMSWALDPMGRASDGTVHGYFSGGLIDSTTIDSADNIYQAFYGGGRVELLNRFAAPIGIVTPRCDDPRRDYPLTTHVAIRPGTRDAVLVAGGPDGLGVFRFEALADGQIPFSHA